MKQIILILVGIILIGGCAQQEQACNGMSLTEAKQIAADSECSQGNLTGSQMCNENTNTWWIDLNIVKQGCNPACVVDVITKQASINWRCTGLINK